MSEQRNDEYRWSAPPAEIMQWHRPIKYAARAAEMREQPGEWRQFPDAGAPRGAYNLADNIRRGRLVAFAPAAWFESLARKCSVWARYVGDEDTRVIIHAADKVIQATKARITVTEYLAKLIAEGVIEKTASGYRYTEGDRKQ